MKPRTPLPPRKSRIARKSAVKKRNPERQKSEFARCYGSRERVAFVKSLGCIACSALSPFFGIQAFGKSYNAHTITGGMGMKAGYDTIVPLCATHHRRYDEHRAPCDDPMFRQAIKNAAHEIERMWQEHKGRAA